MRIVIWGALSIAVVSCGGVSTRHESAGDDDAGGSAGTGNGGSVGASPGSGGRVGIGGTTSPGGGDGGGPTSTGGRVSTGGGPGTGGTIGVGGTSGTGNAGAAGGVATCRFEPIGEGLRCEHAGSRAQDDTSHHLPGVSSRVCFDACLERPDCTAVTDYFGETGSNDGCYIRRGACGTIATDPSAEEDAGKEYAKVCDPATAACRIEYLGDWQRCQGPGTLSPVVTAQSRVDCERTCIADGACTGIVDYFWLGEMAGCYLYTSTCDDPVPLPFGDPGVTHRKVCDAAKSPGGDE